jgi:hypothetical protein
MSFFCLKIEDIAECSMNFISTCPCFKSFGLRSATVPYCINENDVLVKQTSDPKVNSFRVTNDIILVESQAFFPAYFHTLESIKNMHGLVSTKKGKVPFGEQLVSLCVNIEQPEYLRSTSSKESFDFSCLQIGQEHDLYS